MNKKILLFSLASISCIPAINQLCSNYNSHNISINQVSNEQTNFDLSDLNDVDINEISESTEYDDEMPNYSNAKDSWNKEMNDEDHKSFQKFNLSANELSS